jgi:predicted esterase
VPRRLSRALLLLCLGTVGWAPAAVEEPLPRGKVVEKIACLPDPAKSYALYLPSAYDPGRRWPVLYVLDPRGRAVSALERFREAAEAAGWVLVSSYDTASDRQDDPNTPAVNALWGDTQARLSLDPKRAYFAGFSGTGRAAVSMAYGAPGRIAGIIDCGAGFPYTPKKTSSPFPIFFAVGYTDFNYLEVRGLDETLDGLSFPHRVEAFEGAHEWIPASMAPEALAWLDLTGMRAGARPKDGEAIAAFERAGLSRAAAHEAAGRLPEALREAQTLVRDLEGLGDAASARALVARLTADAGVQKALREERKVEERERRDLRAIVERMRRVLGVSELSSPSEAARDLGVPHLRQRAKSDNRLESLSARRLLAEIGVQTGYYLPERALERGDRSRALFLYGIARETEPENAILPVRVAAVQSLAGDTARARKSIEEAVALGFRRLELLETEADFAAMRKDPGFASWLEERKRAAVTPPPTPAAVTPAGAARAGRAPGGR